MTSIHIIHPQTDDEFEQYFRLRWQILRQPWDQPRGSERDELESSACHAMALLGAERCVGVARLHWQTQDMARIRYMAVHPDFQRQGIGTALLHHLESQARASATRLICLDARKAFVRFYLQQGYHSLGAGPLLFGQIEHIRMEKDLAVTLRGHAPASAKAARD